PTLSESAFNIRQPTFSTIATIRNTRLSMIKKYKIARHFLQTCSLLALAFWATTGFTKTADDLPHAVIPAPRTIEFPWMSVATWNKMHAEDVAIAEKGDIDLLFVGDSITEGWDSTLWQKNFAPYKAANFGI